MIMIKPRIICKKLSLVLGLVSEFKNLSIKC